MIRIPRGEAGLCREPAIAVTDPTFRGPFLLRTPSGRSFGVQLLCTDVMLRHDAARKQHVTKNA